MSYADRLDTSTEKQLSKKFLVNAVSDMDELTVEESNENGMLIWDNEEAKQIPVHFLEKMSPAILADMIYISQDIPARYQIDKTALAQYLWDVCDKNAFVTLEEIVVIWSEPTNPENFDPPDFVDEQSRRLYEKYGDEYAFEIGCEYLGQFWFERNTVVVNMGEIVRASEEIAKENQDLSDSFFSLESQVQIGFLMTAIHELRHLQMDANIFLSEDDYPLSLGSEEAVEAYCQERFESSYIPVNLFANLHRDTGKASLAGLLANAEAKAINQHVGYHTAKDVCMTR